MLCFCLVFWLEFLWGQVAVQLMVSVSMMILLQWARPLDSALANNMETFNEVATLLVLYLLMCFSDFVASPETRNDCGKVFIALVAIYAIVHFAVLFSDIYTKIRLSIRKKYYNYRNRKLLKRYAMYLEQR